MDSHSRSASPRDQPRPQHRPPSPPLAPSPTAPPAFDNQAYQHDESDPNHNQSFTSNAPQQNGHKEPNGDMKTPEAVNLELVNLAPKNGNVKQKKDVEVDMNASNPYDEYFVPVNEHRKYMRGEKLYVTADKRGEKGGCKRPMCWTLLGLVVAAIVAIIVLAATGILFTNTPTPVDPYNSSINSARALGGFGQVHDHEHEHNHDHEHTLENEQGNGNNQQMEHDHDHHHFNGSEMEHDGENHLDSDSHTEPNLNHENELHHEHNIETTEYMKDVSETENDSAAIPNHENSFPETQSNNPETSQPVEATTETQSEEAYNTTGSEETNNFSIYVPRTLEGELKIDNLDFLPEYQDPESDEFRDFNDNFSDALKRALFNINALDKGDNEITLEVIQLRPGSVLVTYRINWKPKNDIDSTKDLITADTLNTTLNNYLELNNRMISVYHIAEDNMSTSRVLDLCQINKNECEFGCEFDDVSLNFTCYCPRGQIPDVKNPKTCMSYLINSQPFEPNNDTENKHDGNINNTVENVATNNEIYSSDNNNSSEEQNYQSNDQKQDSGNSLKEHNEPTERVANEDNKNDFVFTEPQTNIHNAQDEIRVMTSDPSITKIYTSKDESNSQDVVQSQNENEFKSYSPNMSDSTTETPYVVEFSESADNETQKELDVKQPDSDAVLDSKRQVSSETNLETKFILSTPEPIQVSELIPVTLPSYEFNNSVDNQSIENTLKTDNTFEKLEPTQITSQDDMLTLEKSTTEFTNKTENEPLTENSDALFISNPVSTTGPTIMDTLKFQSHPTTEDDLKLKITNDLAEKTELTELPPQLSTESDFRFNSNTVPESRSNSQIISQSETTLQSELLTTTEESSEYKFQNINKEPNQDELNHNEEKFNLSMIPITTITSSLRDSNANSENNTDADLLLYSLHNDSSIQEDNDWLEHTIQTDTEQRSDEKNDHHMSNITERDMDNDNEEIKSRSPKEVTKESYDITTANINGATYFDIPSEIITMTGTEPTQLTSNNNEIVSTSTQDEMESVKQNDISTTMKVDTTNNNSMDSNIAMSEESYSEPKFETKMESITEISTRSATTETNRLDDNEVKSFETLTVLPKENLQEVALNPYYQQTVSETSNSNSQNNQITTPNSTSEESTDLSFDTINMLFNRSSKSMNDENFNNTEQENMNNSTNSVHTPTIASESNWVTETVTEVNYADVLDKNRKHEGVENSSKINEAVHQDKDDYEPDYLNNMSSNSQKVSEQDPALYGMTNDYDNEDPRVKRVNKDSTEIAGTLVPRENIQEYYTTSVPITLINDYVYKNTDKSMENAMPELENHNDTNTDFIQPTHILQDNENMDRILPNNTRETDEVINPTVTTMEPTLLTENENHINSSNFSDIQNQNLTQTNNLGVTIYEVSNHQVNNSYIIPKSVNSQTAEYDDHDIEMNPFLPEIENNKSLVKKLQEGHDIETPNLNETQNENNEEHIRNAEVQKLNNESLPIFSKNDESNHSEIYNNEIKSTSMDHFDNFTTDYLYNNLSNKNTDGLETLTKINGSSLDQSMNEDDSNIIMKSQQVPRISTFLLDTDDLDISKTHKKSLNPITENDKSSNNTPFSINSTNDATVSDNNSLSSISPPDNNESLNVVPIPKESLEGDFHSENILLNDISDISSKSDKRTFEISNSDSDINDQQW